MWAELQDLIQLIFQQHLILRHRFHKGGDAFVDRQHVLGAGTGIGTRQCAQDILQLLTLGVEDMAQSELLHGDGGENLIDRVFTLNGWVNFGKAGQRHN